MTTFFAQFPASGQANAPGTYAGDLGTVMDAQAEALAQAKDLLDQTEDADRYAALESAIKEMERAKSALADAKNSPDKLPAAAAAEQAAYQLLLKTIPRETRMTRSNSRNQSGQQQRAGEASRQQMNQLDLPDEQNQNRYETERQAQATPNAQQRERSQVADRLKELAQRQQDLNERLRELQTALSEARTPQEREEAQRQLKRLTDEERQMLADMDELRQQMEQSPNANSLANSRQQLDQARSDAQRAAQEMQNQAPSQALAAGSRAQQGLQNMRQDVRNQAATQFSEQMRQMRSQARDLENRENELARSLESVNSTNRRSLDDSALRQQLGEQISEQQSGLTNLLAQMQNLTQQAETTEPLLAQQLYDAWRNENQSHTRDYLDAGRQLVDHGLIAQAGEVERFARTNINNLRQRVERAAESVLGNEAESLRFAEKELNDLTSLLERELGGAGTNGNVPAGNNSNSVARSARSGAGGTNNFAANNSTNGAQRGNRGQGADGLGDTNSSDLAASDSPRDGQRANRGQGAAGENSANGQQHGNNSSDQQANNADNNNPGNQNAQANNGRGNRGRNANGRNATGQNQATEEGQQAQGGGGGNGGEDLNNFVRQFGRNPSTGGTENGGGGPITGGNYVDWSTRMRDVEQVVDDPALRNQLATARERVAAMRAEFRQNMVKPKPDLVFHQVLDPMVEVRTQLREHLARLGDANSLVPLDHDPVPDKYAEAVQKYYEKLGDGK